MTQREPEQKKVRARDVIPYHWALWCSIGDGKPFANEIVIVRWSEDGKSLSFMLDSHNFFSAEPDEELELVPQDVSKLSSETIERAKREHAKWIGCGPPPLVECKHCKGTGKVVQMRGPFE